MIDIDVELTQYVATALWSSTDDSTESGGYPLDRNYGPEDVAPESVANMRADLESFIQGPACHEDSSAEAIAEHERAVGYWLDELGAGQLGHDFWLTRNGHGAGFWDRFGASEGEAIGRYLTAQATPFGESYAYVGDNGKVYVS